MELKTYQKQVMDDLAIYLKYLDQGNNIFAAWKNYWQDKDISVGLGGVPAYHSAIPGVPHVCMKVPTGGGKTFMACVSLRYVFDTMPLNKPKVVVWLVPSDSILTQTIRNLSNPEHEYRLRLNSDFAGRVGVYTKEMLLSGQNFSPDTVQEQLTICVMSYSSLRIDSKKRDVRKVYQENGNLLQFARYFKDDTVLLADTPDTALIQVLRNLSPIVIVDESHNAGSDLSVEMLNNLNPSLVLDLTATPRENSNILSYVDARELKKENMVKLPVVVYNRTSRQSVIQDAIQLRGVIEQQAIEEERAGGAYIRPIVLFQAQPKINEDSETFEKIKAMLIDMGIPKEEIAVKTSKVDELGKMDLMSHSCEIRYIITVNALKEGWDCPFAYILASLANKTSRVDVEQILGRILRQPYAKSHSSPLLNTSYVLTCSNDFSNTLDNVVSGLNMAGFSRKDFRIGETPTLAPISKAENIEPTQLGLGDSTPSEEKDAFGDINPEEVKKQLEEGLPASGSSVSAMIQDAEQKANAYNAEIEDSSDSGFLGGELGDMLNQNTIQPQFAEEVAILRIPQFCLKAVPDLFGGEYELLEKENLSEGFSLSGQDAQINFELSNDDIYQIDLQETGEAIPKYRRMARLESDFLREHLATLPPEERIQHCTSQICKQLNKNDRYAAQEISAYVHRVIENMTEDALAKMETNIPLYARKIQKKIDNLEQVYCTAQFKKWLDSGKIVCREWYALPSVITPAETIDAIPYSLYEAEKNDMNAEERHLIDLIVGLDNIRWWHRIIDRKGFRINGAINHYPDFMIMTKSGKIVLIEYKGDDRDNSDSKVKLELGRQWQAQAGQNYRYFMVFRNKNFGLDGAYTLERFMEVMKEL